MKRWMLALVLVEIFAGEVWAQKNPEPWGGKKNFVSGSIFFGSPVEAEALKSVSSSIVGNIIDFDQIDSYFFVIGFGVRYERLIIPQLSAGVDLSYGTGFPYTTLDAEMFVRYFFWQGLFAEIAIGYRNIFALYYPIEGGYLITPGVGWKFDPANGRGFFIDASIRAPFTLMLVGDELSFEIGGQICIAFGSAF